MINLYAISFWDIISSRIAFGIYFIVLLVIILFLTVYILTALKIIELNEKENYGNGSKKQRKKLFRFSMLNQLDDEFSNYKEPQYDNITLAEICIKFRNYAANELHLYYSEEDIRRFIAGLGVTKLIILQGMSGTGKTSLAYAAGKFISNDSVIVPVQPMWKERSDMIGYFNEFTKKFNETTLLRKMYEAGYKKEMYITVLDEVNISRVEYYFAEFLSLLELPDPEKRYLDVVTDVWKNDPKKLKDGKIKLPANMWFVGTANNDDSTFAISDKVYDRAMVINLDKKCQPFNAPDASAVKISYKHWCDLISKAKSEYSLDDENRIKIQRLDALLIDEFKISFGNRIMKQIEEYVPVMIACGGTAVQALDDIFARKVLRKLEQQNLAYLKAEMDSVEELLNEMWGLSNLKQCSEYIQKLRREFLC